MGYAGGFQPWLHIRITWDLFKTSNARPHSSDSDLIRKGWDPNFHVFKPPPLDPNEQSELRTPG